MSEHDDQRDGTKRRLLDWRSWSLPTKLLAIMLVPVIFSVSLSITQIRNRVADADEFERISYVLDSVDRVETLLSQVQLERLRAVETLVGSAPPEAFQEQVGRVDRETQAVRGILAGSDFERVVELRADEVNTGLDKLAQLRMGVGSGQIDVPTVISSYSRIAATLIALDGALASTMGDRRQSAAASSLHDVIGMMEEVRIQQSWVLFGFSEGRFDSFVAETIRASRARLTQKILDTRATAPAGWSERLAATVGAQAVARRNEILSGLLASSDDLDDAVRNEWNNISDQVVRLIEDGHADLAAEERAIADARGEEASNAAGRDSVFLLSVLLLAAAIGVVVARQLLSSLRQLRGSALDSAHRALPVAVEDIRLGRNTAASVEAVPVATRDEVGQLARAFDEVNRQALRLAGEQASLRRGYSDSFVSVSRRSQALLERQLRLFEQLEQNEEDPDQLSTLFQLDHLATRMRRNNENLMVLSGSDLLRRFNQPTPLSDVLQSAVSEIEHYPRVVVQPPPQVLLVGHVASDLVRLFAELFDNAANFSPPETTVTVSSAQAEDGAVTVDVLDEGIGIAEADLAEANSRLTEADDRDLASSRRLGLLVVGRLSSRHGVTVRLHGGADVEGVRATVHIPAEHLASQSVPSPAAFAGTNGATQHFETGTELSAGPPTERFPAIMDTPAGGMSVPALDIPQQPRTPAQDFDFTAPAADNWPTHQFWASPAQDSAGPEAQGWSGSWFEPVDAEGYEWPAADGEQEQPQPETPEERLNPGELSRRLAQKFAGVQFDSSVPHGEPSPTPVDTNNGFHPEWGPSGAENGNRAESHTASGLPRRTPRASLTGGDGSSWGWDLGQPEPNPRRDPERLRSRLSDFKSGVQRGKHRAPDEEGL